MICGFWYQWNQLHPEWCACDYIQFPAGVRELSEHQALVANFCASPESCSISSSVRSMISILLSGFASTVGFFSELLSSIG